MIGDAGANAIPKLPPHLDQTMYEAVTIDSDGASFDLVVDRAATFGYDGVVVRNAESLPESSLDDRPIDAVDATTIRTADPQVASGAVGNARSDHTLVLLEGGSPEMNRFAVETEKIDVLTRPMGRDGDVNHVMAKAAATNGVRLECNLGGILRRTGGRRVRAIQSLRKLYELVEYYDAPYVVSAGASSHLELRAPRDLCAVGEQLGLPGEWVSEGLAEWGRLASRNRHVRSESFIEPGVERGRYETDR